MIGRTISHYTITAELGRGGMGVVYRAEDDRLGRSVAIKVLPPVAAGDPKAKDRFIQEARAASAFDHPNICSIYDIGETSEGELYLVMPVYEGGTLRDRMESGPMEVETAVGFARQIASGLGRAHSKGIVHRDIKPDNLMVLEDDRLVILDFGVAKLAEGLDLTSQGSTIGTAAYMSPEQARGDSVDGRSDLWALGAILYEALTGRRPFPGSYDQAVIYGILNSDPEPLDDSIPGPVAGVVSRLLRKSVDDRFPDAEGVLTALEAPGQTAQPLPQTADKTPTKSPALKWIGGAVAAVILAAAVWFGVAGTGETAITPDPALAVMPFDIGGSPELAYLAEGMPTLLSAALDGVGDLRAIDPRSVAAVLDGDPVDAEAVRRVSSSFAAEGAVVGSVTELGQEIRLQAAIHGADGTPGEQRTVTASGADDLPRAVDALARALIAGRFSGRGNAIAGIAAATSHNFEALKFYMEGDALARREEWQQAYEAFARAVEVDSTFAMAWFRMASMSGWGITGEDREGEILAAVRHSEGLPPRAKALIDIDYHETVLRMPITARRLLTDYTRRYPDDAYGWYRLGDNIYHGNRAVGFRDREAIDYLERALSLDPANAEVTIHLAGFALADRDWERVDSLEALTPRPPRYDVDLTGPLRDELGPAAVLSNFSRLGRASADPGALWDKAMGVATVGGEAEIMRAVMDTLSVIRQRPDLMLWSVWHLLREGRYSEAMGVMFKVAELQRMNITEVAWMTLVSPPTFSPELQDLVFGFDAPPREATAGIVADPNLRLVSFALGALLLHQEDWVYLAEVQTALRSHGDPSSIMLATNLDILAAMQKGERAEALAMIEPELKELARGRPPEGFVHDEFFNGDPTALRRWLRAELLFEAGRMEEATRWYQSLHQMSDLSHDVALAYATPAHRRLAEIAEGSGDVPLAIHHYEQVLHHWRGADPVLQPLVDEARSRLDGLLASRSAESG